MAATLQEHQKALVTILEEFDRVCRVLDIPYVLYAGTMLGAVNCKGFIPWDDDVDVMMLRADYERFLREAETVLDTEKFFLQKEFTEHWPMFFSKLRLNGTTCLEKFHPKDPQIHQGVYIDVFPCDDAASSELGRKLQYLASKVVIAKCVDTRGYDTDSTLKKIVMAVSRLMPMRLFRMLTMKGQSGGELVHTFLGGGKAYSKNVLERKFLEQRTTAVFEGREYPVPAEHEVLLDRLYGPFVPDLPEDKRGVKEHAILVDLDNSYETYRGYRDGMDFEVHTRSVR